MANLDCLIQISGEMDNTEDVRTTVELYIYDLTKGMAAMMSHMLIGKRNRRRNFRSRTFFSSMYFCARQSMLAHSDRESYDGIFVSIQ